MNIKDRFQSYAADFELSYADDDWSRLAKYFTEDATYDSGDGSETASGRDAVLKKFQDSVNSLDRGMGQREVLLNSVSIDGDTVVVEWTAKYTNSDLPVLEVNGSEYAQFDGDAIVELRDEIRPESLSKFASWMEANASKLQGKTEI